MCVDAEQAALNATNCTPPEDRLARMMSNDLGVDIDPKKLREFICLQWYYVAKYAHAIHDAGEAGAAGAQYNPTLKK